MKSGQRRAGHPVNVATGTVYSTHTDYSIPGKVELLWERRYCTPSPGIQPTPLGIGWSTRYFATLTRDAEGFRVVTPEGEVQTFADPTGEVDGGGVLRDFGTFQELIKQADHYILTRWDIETGDVERYLFRRGKAGEAWPLESFQNVTGQGLDLLRDASGRLTEIRQRLEKRSLVFDYTPEGRIRSVYVLPPRGQRQLLVRYEYDAAGRLAAAFDALGQADRYTYDTSSRLIREELKDGGVFTFAYDQKGRCVRTAGLDRYDEKTFRYLDLIHWTEVCNSLGNVTRYQWLASGQVVREIDPLGGARQTEYDEHGRIVARVDPNGATTRYEYDSQANRCKIIDPLANETVITYNSAHLPLTLTNHSGSWKYRYNANNRLIESENPSGGLWKFRYNEGGNLVHMTDPNGASRGQSFSQTGALLEATDWEGNITGYAFDPFGRVVKRIDPLGGVTLLQYDLLGRPLLFRLPDNSQISCKYDAGGNLTALTDGNGQTTTWRYGPCARLLEKTDALGNVVRYQWGSEPQRLEKITNAKGESYELDYDAAGRLIRRQEFDGKEYHFKYDQAGNTIVVIDTLGQEIAYALDAAGNVIHKTLPDGTVASFTYDPLGNLISAINPDCEVVFDRDVLGRIIRERQGEYSVESKYDAAGNRIWMGTSLGHEVRCEHDGNGDLTCLTTEDQHTLRFERNSCREETTRFLPGNVQLDQQYDPRGTLVEQRVSFRGWPIPANLSGHDNRETGSAAALISRVYRYDPAGVVTKILDKHDSSTTYLYDPMERLIQAVREKRESETFSYDSNGNITEIRDDEGRQELLQYGPGDRLVRCGNTEYFYDGNGRLITKVENGDGPQAKEWRFCWDGNGQLRSVTNPQGIFWKYTYDALGRRISKDGPGSKVRYLWDHKSIIHQVENENVHSTWLWGNQSFVPLCMLQGSSAYSVITDHLGTPRELLDKHGRIVWSATYNSWGEVSKGGVRQVACPLRFQGQWFDEESGLHFSRFRHYDPKVGRFISPDPIGLLGGLNAYSYAPNPTNWVDPLGLTSDPGCGPTEEEDDKPQYFIQSGVRRAVAARERGSPTIPAIIYNPPNPPVRVEIPLDQLNSPKPVVPRDPRMVNILMLPGPPPPIEVVPMPGPQPSVPLADVKLVKARP